MGRKSWDEYFMEIADKVSERGTCDRKHVGAVIVRDRNILSTGYNGSIPGSPHCDEVGHMMEDGHCVRTIHAEANAIIQAAKHGHVTKGATLYSNASPCWPCFKLIVGAGISRIVFKEVYREDRIFEFAKDAEVELLYLRTCCPWHKRAPGPVWDKMGLSLRGMHDPELCRCLREDCNPCKLEVIGCGCDGSMDEGCFICTPKKFPRPECETLERGP